MAEIFKKILEPKKLFIADLKVLLFSSGERLANQTRNYICDWTGKADIEISIDEETLSKRHYENPHLSLDSCEYIMTGSKFYSALIDYSGFMLHASAVVYQGKAYLFSAPCGTGKSTHTSLWRERFGDEAVILNDDKPAVRLVDGEFYAYGTPWSGKTDKQVNMCVPIAAIAFIEQDENNSITKIDNKTALTNILSQTVRPRNLSSVDKLYAVMDKFIKKVNVYSLKCNMEHEAVDVAYEAMSKNL